MQTIINIKEDNAEISIPEYVLMKREKFEKIDKMAEEHIKKTGIKKRDANKLIHECRKENKTQQ
ncbi:MAG: hypothetical protein BWK75_00105 [Candidatus Altiarchaeales archaeon A3]|nr:MAG: hypothetical protein BWK75_00105 [Candidatus Altiarchaeales archaeon A3]